MTTTVVIPCYNEAARLPAAAFRAYAETHDDVDFLFVNDGSTDDTQGVLDELCAADHGRLRALALERNSGKAEAVRAGILHACAREPRPACVAFWDADLSTGLEEILAFRAILDERPELTMVFGARVNLLGREVKRKLFRHYLGRVFATVAAWALGLPIYDTQCGAKMFRATDELAAVFAEPFISRWIFDVEVIARFLVARRGTDLPAVRDVIYEKPLMRWVDVAGSKIRRGDLITLSVDFVKIWNHYLRRDG